jgi:hypothetical protein
MLFLRKCELHTDGNGQYEETLIQLPTVYDHPLIGNTIAVASNYPHFRALHTAEQ